MDNIHAPTVGAGSASQPTENGVHGTKTLPELIARKDSLESELKALGAVLDSHGVTMQTSLLTFDGFPRADIDVAQIRTTRARITRLKTDHKAIMAEIETAVYAHFAATDDNKANAPPAPAAGEVENSADRSETGPVAQSNPASTVFQPPFARINTVSPGSPAEQAGLLPGDRVIMFGSIDFTNYERLAQIAQVVQQNENRVVLIKVLRSAASSTTSATQYELRLTPRSDWGGRGLLGCHILPI